MFGLLRKLVNLAIFLLVANALYQFVPRYVHYVQFRDAVKETALFSKGVPDAVLVDKIVSLAEEHRVPVDRDLVEIRRDRAHVYIDASYVQDIPFLPTYRYRWAFEVRADAINLAPPRGADDR